MDITIDGFGFGFMLGSGDLAWLPFIYSLQARYLAMYPVYLGYTSFAGLLAIQAFGYYHISVAQVVRRNDSAPIPRIPRSHI